MSLLIEVDVHYLRQIDISTNIGLEKLINLLQQCWISKLIGKLFGTLLCSPIWSHPDRFQQKTVFTEAAKRDEFVGVEN